MQIEEVISKVQELREGHSRANLQEILGDLKEFRKVLLEEMEAAEKTQTATAATSGDSERQNYRVLHLTRSYLELLESSQKEKEEMKKEIERLNYRINILKENIRTD